MREQRERAKAEKERDELRGRLKAIETEGDPFKRAKALWNEKKYTQAVKTGFGVKAFDDDLLVQLAGDEPEPERLTEEQLTERIRNQLEQERKAQEEQHATQLQQMRHAAVQEVGQHLGANADKYPTVWALGISGEDLAAAIDAMPERWATPPDKVFEQLEQAYRAKIQGLSWIPKTGEPTPAPRSFGSESRRGPVDAADPAKPLTFKERQEQRAQREREWRAQRFPTQS